MSIWIERLVMTGIEEYAGDVERRGGCGWRSSLRSQLVAGAWWLLDLEIQSQLLI